MDNFSCEIIRTAPTLAEIFVLMKFIVLRKKLTEKLDFKALKCIKTRFLHL